MAIQKIIASRYRALEDKTTGKLKAGFFDPISGEPTAFNPESVTYYGDRFYKSYTETNKGRMVVLLKGKEIEKEIGNEISIDSMDNDYIRLFSICLFKIRLSSGW